MHSIRHKGIVAASAALLVLPALSAPAQAEAPPVSVQNPQDYSGSDLYQAIFFGQGPAVEGLEGIVPQSPDPEADAVAQHYRDIAVADIEETDPGYFDAFHAEVTSGDQLRVLDALSTAGDKAVVALQEEGIDLAAEVDSGNAEAECIFIVVVVAVAAAITVAGGANAVAGANFVAAANVAAQVNVAVAAADEQTLDQDRFVDDVTQRLSA
ncbi:hypothetical protein [Nocardiopsis coralliicola]